MSPLLLAHFFRIRLLRRSRSSTSSACSERLSQAPRSEFPRYVVVLNHTQTQSRSGSERVARRAPIIVGAPGAPETHSPTAPLARAADVSVDVELIDGLKDARGQFVVIQREGEAGPGSALVLRSC